MFRWAALAALLLSVPFIAAPKLVILDSAAAVCSQASQFGLDGSAATVQTTGTTTSLSLTTAQPSGIIIAMVAPDEDTTGTGISFSATGLSFTQRVGIAGSNTSLTYAWAPYTSPFSGSITVTKPSGYYAYAVFGVGCAATTNPFDANASLPAISSSGSAPSFSTSNANDFVLGATAGNTGDTTVDSGYTMIYGDVDIGGNSPFGAAEYRVVSATQSSIALSFSGTHTSFSGDAIKRGF